VSRETSAPPVFGKETTAAKAHGWGLEARGALSKRVRMARNETKLDRLAWGLVVFLRADLSFLCSRAHTRAAGRRIAGTIASSHHPRKGDRFLLTNRIPGRKEWRYGN